MIDRRRLLGGLLGGLAALAGGLPALLFWWRSARGPGEDDETWVDLGPAPKVPQGEWLERTVRFERRDRWRREQASELVYLFRRDREFTVLSAVCPHTGCLVRRRDGGFTCPCHKSFFDARGRSVEGPSPRDLDTLEWKVDKRRLKVRYQRFRPGVTEKVAV